MKLRRLTLRPFAGLADRTIELGPELTVISSPNEGGKSTIFRAIECVLFVPTDQTPVRAKQATAALLPAGGGDTIAVEIEFSHETTSYRLRRQWGSSPAARLELPDGGVVTGEPEITGRLAGLLGASAGTFRSVLMARQAGLARTLEGLRAAESTETVQAMSDRLTAAVQETDGVSVDGLVAAVDAELKGYMSRWDRKRRAPEAGRGIDNPWRKERGKVLTAFYAMEEARARREAAIAIEKRIDELNRRIAELTALDVEHARFLDAHKEAVASVDRRQALDAQASLLALKKTSYSQAMSEWPVLLSEVARLDGQKGQLEAAVEQLEREQAAAALAESRRKWSEQLERVKARKAALDAAEQALGATKVVTAAQLAQIEQTAGLVSKLQTRLQAGRLHARLTAKEPLTTALRVGLEAPRDQILAAGSTLEIEAAGAFALDSAQWTLEVQSGSVDFSAIASELESAKATLASLLRAAGASNDAEARLLRGRRESAEREVEGAQRNLQFELAGQSVEELLHKAGGDGAQPATRALADVRADRVKATAELEANRKEAASKRGGIVELEASYGDTSKLIDLLVANQGESTQVEAQRAKLAPLPAGYADGNALVAAYRAHEAAGQATTKELRQLEIDKAAIPPPAESAEELDVQYRELRERFEAVLRKAEAIARVRRAIDEVQGESGTADRAAALRRLLEQYVARLTDARYAVVQMSDTLPAGLVRGDGTVLGAHLLSTGTLDVLGLALRLAMGRYFLGVGDGFLAMDDPLVDLDPTRQAAAAALLRDYAAERQVIVFTAQPAHAALLGGARVEL